MTEVTERYYSWALVLPLSVLHLHESIACHSPLSLYAVACVYLLVLHAPAAMCTSEAPMQPRESGRGRSSTVVVHNQAVAKTPLGAALRAPGGGKAMPTVSLHI